MMTGPSRKTSSKRVSSGEALGLKLLQSVREVNHPALKGEA